jgi:hypothetical protein
VPIDLVLDAKATKLTAKVNAKPSIVLGDPIALALPVKNGSLLLGGAALLGLGVASAVAVEAGQRASKARGDMAKAVSKAVGGGSDQILCFGDEAVRIVRLVGFGAMGSNPTVVRNADIEWIHTDENKLGKQVMVLFTDRSVLSYKVPRREDRALLAQLAPQLWTRPAQLA